MISELANLRAIARAGRHYAPIPDWRLAPGFDMGKETKKMVSFVSDEPESHASPPSRLLRDTADAPAQEPMVLDDTFARNTGEASTSSRKHHTKRKAITPLGKGRRSRSSRIEEYRKKTLQFDKSLGPSKGIFTPACARCGRVHKPKSMDDEDCKLYTCLCSDSPGHFASECTVPCRQCVRSDEPTGTDPHPTAMNCNKHCGMCLEDNDDVKNSEQWHITCRVQKVNPSVRAHLEERIDWSRLKPHRVICAMDAISARIVLREFAS